LAKHLLNDIIIILIYIFMPVAVETGGPWNQQAIEFIHDLGRRMSSVTKEPMETRYLFQRMSMAIQRGNAIDFQSTFISDLKVVSVITTLLNINI
jgi:hypothetical protein